MNPNPEYFQRKPKTWAITNFLNYQYSRQPFVENPEKTHQKIVNQWIESLRHFRQQGNDSEKAAAEKLWDRYYGQSGKNSDRCLARNYFQRQFGPSESRRRISAVHIYKNVITAKSVQSVSNGNIVVEDGRDVVRGLRGGNEERNTCSRFSLESSSGDLISFDINKLQSFYRRVPAEDKMCLPTGRYLEDIIAENVDILPIDHKAIFGLIDPEDYHVKKLLQPAELDAFSECMAPPPEADAIFMNQLLTLMKCKTEAEFRHVLHKTSYLGTDEEYDHGEHFDAEWVHMAVKKMLDLLRNGALRYPHLLNEGWYDSTLWSFLVDHCMLSLKEMVLQRKEIKPNCLKSEDCQFNSEVGLTYSDLRFDGIFSNPQRLEFGAIEVSKDRSKWDADGSKLAMVLQLMLRRCCDRVKDDKDVVKELQMVGFLHGGCEMQILRVTRLSKNMSLLSRGKIQQVPTDISNMNQLFLLMKHIHMAKGIIGHSSRIVERYLIRSSEEENLQSLLNANEF